MLQLAIEAALIPDPEDPDAADLAVQTYLETSLGGEVRREPIPEGFWYHRLHRRRLLPPRPRRKGYGQG
jgi:hypothetical protein